MQKTLIRASLFLALLFLALGAASAQDPDHTSPLYFGPNALPVPRLPQDINKFRAELSYGYSSGYGSDYTHDISVYVNIPLFSDRVSISCWFPIHEFYTYTPERLAFCDFPDDMPLSGHETGDAIIHTNIAVLKETARCPELLMRCAMSTASSDKGYFKGRFYDSAGNFFDATLSKSFGAFRASATTGFLCWQTNNGHQNDAIMYGLRAIYEGRAFFISEQFGGYIGWQNNGDRPMVLRTETGYRLHDGHFAPLVCFTWGIKDYPYLNLHIGLRYTR